MAVYRVSDGGNNDVYFRVRGQGTLADPFSYDAAQAYEPVKVQTLTASGTVISGVAGSVIAIEYHTQQNLGTADATMQLKDGTVIFNQNLLPYTPGQNFMYIGASSPGREFRLTTGNPFVVEMTGSGSVLTNTRYWYEANS